MYFENVFVYSVTEFWNLVTHLCKLHNMYCRKDRINICCEQSGRMSFELYSVYICGDK